MIATQSLISLTQASGDVNAPLETPVGETTGTPPGEVIHGFVEVSCGVAVYAKVDQQASLPPPVDSMAFLPPPRSPLLFLLVLLLGAGGGVRSYEAPADREDVFSRRACPAFLSFSNAAHLAGVTVELACRCKPSQVREVVWFYRKHQAGPEATRALTDLHGNRFLDPDDMPDGADLGSRFSIRLFSLLLYRAEPGDSGLYLCGSAHQDFFYGYDLDIQEAGALILLPSISQGRRESDRLVSPGAARPRFQVFTKYGEWGRCDRCGPPGEQVRVGLCFLHSPYLHVRYLTANQSVASCGSGAVPRAFGLSQHSKRPAARLEVRACHVTCPSQAPPTSSIPSVKDFLGISSVPVLYLSRPANQDLTLGCPGSRPQHAVAWDRGSEPIYRFDHLTPPNLTSAPPRMHLDVGGHLIFRPAHLEDSGIYYCWLQGRKATEIRLLVYAHFGRGHVTSHPDFQSALRTVLMSYAAMTTVFTLLVLARAALGKFRNTRI
ncbi:Ig-like V-type domain-containing protein FAM187A [Merluccius polli]|uniref:Ig-like V-type domain-containing protein FAM187A n=1 Tax=Merluccius polli TaxID=89951 RepID=A0AA47M749_MERPO|nr:Ig-like V-type domain-containing protein FAM187A [Merluccius polli]